MRALTCLLIVCLFVPAAAQKKAAISQFAAALTSPKDKARLYQFLTEHEKKVVSLDLTLTEEDWNDAEPDEDHRINLDLEEAEFLIDLTAPGGLKRDAKTRRIIGQVRIVSITGPNQGIMSVYAKPVK